MSKGENADDLERMTYRDEGGYDDCESGDAADVTNAEDRVKGNESGESGFGSGFFIRCANELRLYSLSHWGATEGY